MFGGAFVVDNYALALKGFFLVVAYISMLMSADYIGEGDYYQGEFYFLLLTSVLGMVVMASARDLISIFVALETITIPTFILAGWRKHDEKLERSGDQVLPDRRAVVGGHVVRDVAGLRETGSTLLSGQLDVNGRARDTSAAVRGGDLPHPRRVRVQGERGAVPLLGARHLPGRAHAGHRVPVGRVEGGRVRRDAEHRCFGFFQSTPDGLAADAVGPRGGVDDLRQPRRAAPDQHRAHAGLLVDRAGRVHPRPARGRRRRRRRAVASFEAVVIYILIYGAMNLGAFAVVIAVARRTRSGEIDSYSGLGQTAPGLAVAMSMFMLSLAGIPPLAGWFAKFVMFRAVFSANTPARSCSA